VTNVHRILNSEKIVDGPASVDISLVVPAYNEASTGFVNYARCDRNPSLHYF
jgi:hypothetical protein